jgi:hypothetical protein
MSNDKEFMHAFFDKAVGAVVAQGKPSMNKTSCLYRGPGGTKCALGHMLTDEQLKEFSIKEGSTPEHWDDDLIRQLLPCEHMATAQNFMMLLQDAHDDAGRNELPVFAFESLQGLDFVEAFLIQANEVAETYGLAPFVLPTKEDT